MFKVYWTEDSLARSSQFIDMNEALKCVKVCRDNGYTFVTMVSENPNCVGKPGVDSVVDGKLPDGSNYEWKKRRK